MTLVSDSTQDQGDRYGRRLAYVVPTGAAPLTERLPFLITGLLAGQAREPATTTATFRATATRSEEPTTTRGLLYVCEGLGTPSTGTFREGDSGGPLFAETKAENQSLVAKHGTARGIISGWPDPNNRCELEFQA